MKTGKAAGPSDVSYIQVMDKICQSILDRFGMPVVWALSMVFTIFKGKGDIWNCSCYGAVKLHEHGMIVV